MRSRAVVVALWATAACGETAGSAVDAAVDARVIPINPPLPCPTSNPHSCTEALPLLVGTWKFSPSTTQAITLTTTANPVVLAGATAGVPMQMMNLFDGDWNVEPTDAWHCRKSGSSTTISSICKQASGEIRIAGDTRVPGFHTAYETTEYYSGTLVP